MSRGRGLASRQPRGSKSDTSASPRCFYASPRSCLGFNVRLRYDIAIHNYHPFIFCIYVFKTFMTQLHLCINSVFRLKLNMFSVCVAAVATNNYLNTFTWFSAVSPRPRQCCLGLGIGLVKTASPTSLTHTHTHTHTHIIYL